MGKVNIGMRQAQRLAQVSPAKRLAFLAEGMPLIRDSALGFWTAAKRLKKHPREKEVLEGFAEEEAAKGLILMDIVRCPKGLLNQRMQPMLGWFYNHLARLIYAKAASWKPMHTRQLQEYVNDARQAHELEGYAGEYIVPNWEEYRRESQLYVDIVAFQDGTPERSAPVSYNGLSFGDYMPESLQVIDALHHLGLTTEAGLKATADVWGTVTFRDQEGHQETDMLTRQLLERATAEKLPLKTATNKHVQTLYESWQLPMYLLDLRKIDVPLDTLLKRQEAMYWAEVGEP